MTLNFEFDPEKLEEIRANRGLNLPPAGATKTAPRIPRKRGRPRKNPIPEPINQSEELQSDEIANPFESVPLIKTDEKQFAKRLANLLTGTTGLAAVSTGKTYMEMTDEEAADIAEPLASYLIRRAPDSETIREFVENYDLIAFVSGTASYAGRVYRDRRNEVEAQRVSRVQSDRSATGRASVETRESPSDAGGGSNEAINSEINLAPSPIIGFSGQP